MLLRTFLSVDSDDDGTFDRKHAAQLIVDRARLDKRSPALSEYHWRSLEGVARSVAVRTCLEAAHALRMAGNEGTAFVRLVRAAAITSGFAEMGRSIVDEIPDEIHKAQAVNGHVDLLENALKWARMDDPTCDWPREGPDERWALSASERLGAEAAISEIRYRALMECLVISTEPLRT